MLLLSYLIAILIGGCLGLIGAGGSILTVPVLVYLLDISPVSAAMAYGLFIVGITALYGGTTAIIKKQVNLRTLFAFAVPSFISSYLTRKYFVPFLPSHWFQVGGYEVNKGNGLMFLFALLMLASGLKMVFSSALRPHQGGHEQLPLIVVCGVLVGLLAGTVGAGGGFLIIPALVLFAGIPMKTAVNTSLVIIAINSLSGFVGDLQNDLDPDWKFLLSFAGFALVGIVVGKFLATRIDGSKLKTGFGYFVLILAVVVIVRELSFSYT